MDGKSMAPYPFGEGRGWAGEGVVFSNNVFQLLSSIHLNVGFTSDPFITETAIALLHVWNTE